MMAVCARLLAKAKEVAAADEASGRTADLEREARAARQADRMWFAAPPDRTWIFALRDAFEVIAQAIWRGGFPRVRCFGELVAHLLVLRHARGVGFNLLLDAFKDEFNALPEDPEPRLPAAGVALRRLSPPPPPPPRRRHRLRRRPRRPRHRPRRRPRLLPRGTCHLGASSVRTAKRMMKGTTKRTRKRMRRTRRTVM